MNTYTIRRGGAGFQVHMIGPRGTEDVVTAEFLTEAEAQEWVDNESKLEAAGAHPLPLERSA